MVLGLTCSYTALMLFFIIAFLVDWIKSYRQIRKYLAYGLAMGVILLALELPTLSAAPHIWTTMLPLYIFSLGTGFLKMIGFTMLGMYYCFLMGRPSFPILLQRFKVVESFDIGTPLNAPPEALPFAEESPALVSEPTGEQPATPDSGPAVVPIMAPPPVTEVSWRRAVGDALAVAVISVIYSVVLFLLVSPQLSETMRKMALFHSLHSGEPGAVQTLGLVLIVAFAEEILFRLGIQSFLARYLKLREGRYWIAVLITTIIWTLGHAGVLEPRWVKLAQVFPVGLLLGWLCKRHGVESSILAHMLFNVVLACLSSSLLIQ